MSRPPGGPLVIAFATDLRRQSFTHAPCSYCLNFHGRVTVASVKNFQMCYEDNVEPVLLQVMRDA